MRVQSIPGAVPLYVANRFLSSIECHELIQQADAVDGSVAGQQAWRLYEEGTYDQAIMVDADLAQRLWPRVQTFLPPTYDGYHLLYLNPYFRFSRYQPGTSVPMHYDGKNEDHHSSGVVTQAYFTLNIFLNHNFEGGSTDFYHRPVPDEQPRYKVEPETGRAALFWSAQPHCGTTVTHGVKYLLRTDVMGLLHPTDKVLQQF
jgi:predicted 2-oxoglutarate/Fe(II)-dependent dioxygenase YbiX